MTDRPRRLLILGATGSLGRHVLRQALDAGHTVTAFVRSPSRLAPADAARVSVHVGDLRAGLPQYVVRRHDALINCAGHVNDGQAFVSLVDQIVTTVERLPATEQPICWFLAGAALLEINAAGSRGIDLPAVKATYWPHEINFERVRRSPLDWRLLCPGPMVDDPPLGVDRLRSSLDMLPIDVPVAAGESDASALLSAFASVVRQMIVPYADAAAIILRNLERDDATSRHRVGLALPVGTQP